MLESGEETLAGETSDQEVSARDRGERLERLQRGDALGRYTVLELLGHGGMGLVYAAYDPGLDRRVAVKVLHARGSGRAHERARQRLLLEAQAMAKLSHPNVVTVHDVGTVDDEVFLAMEHVDGTSLDRWLAEQPRAWPEVVDMFVQAGRGLAAAHAAGLVHRDFKPANVLVDRSGRARVTDFGLARVHEPSASASSVAVSGEVSGARLTITEGDALVGTPAYMAPEQHARAGVDARTDQFGFCVALFEALVHRHPFGGETLIELATAVSQGRLREMPGDTDVPAHVRRAVLRGLSHDPDLRFPDMDALLAALLADPARKRRRWLGIVVGVAALTGAVAVGVRAAPSAPEPPPPCRGAGDGIDAVWTPERSAAIARAFQATAQPHAATVWSRSTPVIDAHAARWRGSAIDACEATRVRGEQSDALFDRRRACLDRRLRELDVRLALLEHVDAAMVDHGFDVATSLTPIDACEDAERLMATVPLPEDPARAAAVEAMMERLAAAQASITAGRATQIAPTIGKLMTEAKALDYAPVRAEARWVAAQVEESLGRFSKAEALMMQAAEDAAEGHDDLQLARVLGNLPYLVGYLQARFAEVDVIAPLARAAIVRAGRPSRISATFEQGMGSTRLRQGDRAAAREHYVQALARLHDSDGQALQRSHMLNNLGVLAMLDGDYDGARQRFAQAHAERKGLLHPSAPEVVDHHHNLANLAFAQGDLREAIAQADRALEVLDAAGNEDGPQALLSLLLRAQALATLRRFEAARADVDRAIALSAAIHGPDHAQGFGYAAWSTLARLEREEGRYPEARAAITRALELGRKVLGDDNPDVSQLVYERGMIELLAGDLDEARGWVDDALARSEAGFGADHPLTAAVLRAQGSLDLAQSRATARERLERAVEILERRRGDSLELARGRFDLARALPATDGTRARRLAMQARERLAADELSQEVATIDAWLEAHPADVRGG